MARPNLAISNGPGEVSRPRIRYKNTSIMKQAEVNAKKSAKTSPQRGSLKVRNATK